MRLKSFLLILVAVLYALAVANCGPSSPTTQPPDNQNQNQNINTNSNQNDNVNVNVNVNANDNINANDNVNANDNGNANGNGNANDNSNSNVNSNDNANANGNDSGAVKFKTAAGVALSAWPPASTNPALAFDGQGRLNLFYQTSAPNSGRTLAHAQLNAAGSWTAAAPAATDFQFITSLDLLPDASGKLCMLWGGSQYDQSGNSVEGLFRNCQQADGSFAASATLLAKAGSAPAFSVGQAAGALRAVYVSRGALYYSAVSSAPGQVLTGTKLSGDTSQVLQARLSVDAGGGAHAVWEEAGDGAQFTIQARDSSDGGKTWGPAKPLYSGSADNPASISLQLVADSAKQAHLAWDSTDGIWYRRWTATGGWGEPVKLSGGARQAMGVQLAVTQDGLARAVWNEFGADTRVALAEQAADGTWGPPQTVTPTQGRQEALAVDAQGVNYVVWRSDSDARYLTLP